MTQRRQSVLLCNGQSGYRTLLAAEIRVLSKTDGLVEYIASDETIDSYREIVRADGWRFDLFKKNSPFVDTHDYSTIGKLLGNVVDWRVDKQKRQLVETVKWAKDVEKNTLAQLGWEMLVAGFGPKAVSVGFIPASYVTKWDSDLTAWRDQLDNLGLHEEDGVRVIYIEQQQIELSACILGANPNALQMARKAFEAGVLNKREFYFLQTARTAPQFQVPFKPQQTITPTMKKNLNNQLKRIAGNFDKTDPNSGDLSQPRLLSTDLLSLGTSIQRTLENPERRLLLNALGRRLMNAKLNADQEQCLKAQSEDSGFGTSYIADDFADEIYNLLAQYGAWATLGVQIIRSKRAKFAITTAYPNAAFVLQGVPLDDDTAYAGDSFLADTVTIACLIKCAVSLFDDAEADISEHLLEMFVEAFNARLDTAVFIGNGNQDADNGGMTGIFTDDTIKAVESAAGNVALELCERDDFLNVVPADDFYQMQACLMAVASALSESALLRSKVISSIQRRVPMRATKPRAKLKTKFQN